jgi:hypothetical protein
MTRSCIQAAAVEAANKKAADAAAAAAAAAASAAKKNADDAAAQVRQMHVDCNLISRSRPTRLHSSANQVAATQKAADDQLASEQLARANALQAAATKAAADLAALKSSATAAQESALRAASDQAASAAAAAKAAYDATVRLINPANTPGSEYAHRVGSAASDTRSRSVPLEPLPSGLGPEHNSSLGNLWADQLAHANGSAIQYTVVTLAVEVLVGPWPAAVM